MSRRSTAAVTAAADRRRKVAALYLDGLDQLQIARELKVSQSTVSTDLAAVRAAWEAEAVADFNSKKAEELAEIEAIKREAIEGYRKNGTADFLRVRCWCSEQRSKIKGFDAAKQLQILGAVAVTVEAPPPDLTPDELAQLADLAVRMGVLDGPQRG